LSSRTIKLKKSRPISRILSCYC